MLVTCGVKTKVAIFILITVLVSFLIWANSHSWQDEESQAEQVPNPQFVSTTRTGVLTFLSKEEGLLGPEKRFSYSFIFTTMLFSSWKQNVLLSNWHRSQPIRMHVDLLVYCEESICDELPLTCKQLLDIPLQLQNRHPKCFYRRLPFLRMDNIYLKSYSYMRDPKLDKIISHYRYILRTDPDVFLTPHFFTWLPSAEDILVLGQGGYSTSYNYRLLKRIARSLGWNSGELYNIGSTWLIRSHLVVTLTQHIVLASTHIWDNYFDESKVKISYLKNATTWRAPS